MNLIGKKIGRTIVLSEAGKDKYGKTIFNCLCDCGNKVEILRNSLVTGNTVSCGCFRKENTANLNKGKIIHGMRHTRLYHIFISLKQRCVNPKTIGWKYYGGKGVRCLWKSFLDFKNDMLESYLDHVSLYGEKQTTIDRIKNDQGYCKENCRWATYKIQENNRTNSKLALPLWT